MSNLTNNTTELQAVLEILQDKVTGVTLPELSNEGTAADLLEGKEFIDSFGNKIVGTLSLDAEMATQAELIEQLRTALENKGAGGGGGNDEYKDFAISLIDRKATSIVIPEGTTEIGNYAFCDFDYLTEVSIPNTVKYVRYRAFYACPLLTHITFPASVTGFSSGQHFHSSGITSLTFERTTPPSIVSGAFADTIQTIYVPASAVDAYKSATNWSAYASKIVGV